VARFPSSRRAAQECDERPGDVTAQRTVTCDGGSQAPVDAQLVGASFFVQGAVLVPGFNAGSLVVSNALQVVVGTP
jgi:hypothetical protein